MGIVPGLEIHKQSIGIMFSFVPEQKKQRVERIR
jgi:hypothetical protein